MRKLLILVPVVILSCSLTGCKELDKLSELERMVEMMGESQLKESADSLTEDTMTAMHSNNDSTIYDVVNFNADSLNHYTMQTVIKKVVLERHDYWTIVGVGENKGGVGIVHSMSCWCIKNNNKYND